MTIKALALAGVFLAGLAAAASSSSSAHVTFETLAAEAGSTYKGVLRVGHGCDGLVTTAFRVLIPDGVINAKPMPKPGWTLDTAVGPYAELCGETVTEGVRGIAWSGGVLPDDWSDEFIFRATLSQGEAGQVIVFTAIQECGEARMDWSEVAAEGQDPYALEYLAPTQTLISPEHHTH